MYWLPLNPLTNSSFPRSFGVLFWHAGCGLFLAVAQRAAEIEEIADTTVRLCLEGLP